MEHALVYPCNIFFMRENKSINALYLLEGAQKESVILDANSSNNYRIDQREVSSFEDVLNIQHLPGFVRYVGISVIDEHSNAV